MTNKKLRLRPWVKVAMLFIVGAVVVTKIFSLMGASASTEEPQTKVYYGVVNLNVNGESHLSMVNGDFKKDLVIKQQKNYYLGNVVTVVMEGDKVIKDYRCVGEELKRVEKKYSFSISSVRANLT
ncbi:hypothetical protein V7094_28605, partial [Priestia megaterium]|uniref:hypothetical protein n=1 Tax=Priestia megaterium TaxID=1404 RepID=UPI002FFDAA4D